MAMTFGELRRLIAKEQLGWQPPTQFADDVPLPMYSIGASEEGLRPADARGTFDLRELGVSSNVFLAARRAEVGLVTRDAVRQRFSPRMLRRVGLEGLDVDVVQPEPGDAGAPPAALDWRNRWGATGSPRSATRTRATPAGRSPAPR